VLDSTYRTCLKALTSFSAIGQGLLPRPGGRQPRGPDIRIWDTCQLRIKIQDNISGLESLLATYSRRHRPLWLDKWLSECGVRLGWSLVTGYQHKSQRVQRQKFG
jgi:hypothetical protein